MNPLCALHRQSTFYLFRVFKRGYVLALVLFCVGALPAQAEGLTGDYKVYHNDITDENIRYQCNSMDAYVNGGGSLSGVLECNFFKLTANGHTVVAFSGNVENVDVSMINDRSTLLLVHLDVANLHVENAIGGSNSYFAISKSATIDMVNGARVFIRSSDKSGTAPTVRVVNLQGGGEIYWCGVKIQADHVNGGKLVEDCSWLR
jgi:hypothetical protein